MITTIIGLGNPGAQYAQTRHNIGFMVLDTLAIKHYALFKNTPLLQHASFAIHGHSLVLVKPLTYMNNSGAVMQWLRPKGVTAGHILVVHDELEQPFGKVRIKQGGSARGHNGLRSLIEVIGPDFARLQIGIGRPAAKDDVPEYVLSPFSEPAQAVEDVIHKACFMIESMFE